MQGERERESCVCFRGIERDLEREEERTHFLPLSRALFRTLLVDLEGTLGLTGVEALEGTASDVPFGFGF
jgi:hypothetical protein